MRKLKIQILKFHLSFVQKPKFEERKKHQK